MTLKLRKDGELPKCSVLGCKEYPGRKTYNRPFCEGHARELSELIAERNFREFSQALKQGGSEPKVCLHTDAGWDWMKLKCSVQPCDKLARGGSQMFVSKEPAWLYLCEDHNKILQEVFARDYGSALVWEWTQRRKVREDSGRADRIKAIKTSTAKHEGQRDYMAKVCSDLKVQRIKMLPSWRERWEKEGERFDPDDWPRAYKDARFRPAIQKYISRHK